MDDVPTDKLMELFIKYDNVLKNEMLKPVFQSEYEIQASRDERELLETISLLKFDQDGRGLTV